MFAQSSALRRLAEIAPASFPSFWSGVMLSLDGGDVIEEQGPSFDVVGEVVGVAQALATEPPQEASVRGGAAGSEGGEPVQDQEARSTEHVDAESEEAALMDGGRRASVCPHLWKVLLRASMI